MTQVALKIDIQTILKLVRFNEEFRYLFKNLSFFSDYHKTLIDEYTTSASIFSKEILWGLLSTEDYIPEVNYIINLWRNGRPDYKEVETAIEAKAESEAGHNIVGKVVEFDNIQDKYKKLILEEKRQKFQYNGFKVLPTRTGFLQLFY